MKVMKDIMLQNGIDLDKIRTDFFASEKRGDNCKESIKGSKMFIVSMCKSKEISIWDCVKEEQKDLDNDTSFTEYQKMMAKASLLLAWEELERDEHDLCLELHANSKQ